MPRKNSQKPKPHEGQVPIKVHIFEDDFSTQALFFQVMVSVPSEIIDWFTDDPKRMRSFRRAMFRALRPATGRFFKRLGVSSKIQFQLNGTVFARKGHSQTI